MDQTLKDILESDYKFVLISGDYFDCPTCNPMTSFVAATYYEEKDLLEAMIQRAGSDRMEAIWVIDSYSGDMAKFSDIKTKAGGHQVQRMEFELPSGKTMIIRENGKYILADAAYMVLYGNK